MELQNFWNGYNSRKRRLLRVLFFRMWSTRWRPVTVLKACAFYVGKAPIRDLLMSIHKTRDFEWQTAHTKGCQENRCDIYNCDTTSFVLHNCSTRVWSHHTPCQSAQTAVANFCSDVLNFCFARKKYLLQVAKSKDLQLLILMCIT